MKTQQANATLYPDRILIATEDRTVVGYSITTPKVTKVPVDSIAEVIGRTGQPVIDSSVIENMLLRYIVITTFKYKQSHIWKECNG